MVEDTDYTLEDIKGMNFGDDVMRALELLTHDKDVPYMEYVKLISSDPLATKVKLADLEHNSDLSRLDTVTEHDLERQRKYLEAIRILTENKK